jgi:hypothetical protein
MNIAISKHKYAVLAVLVIGLSLPVAISHIASAAAPDYVQDELVDDSVFLDSNSMNANQIQSFLTSIGSSLATYTTTETLSIYPNYNHTVSAAELIYDAGQVYGINPQVIMATLQKEQSLITDPTPTASQMNFAMGYGCADSTGCSKYAGFFNQVDNATWQFRFDYERASGNSSWWNSTLSYPCKSATAYYSTGLLPGNNVTFYNDYGAAYDSFTLQNASTSTLYCYTPHAYPGSSQEYYSGSYNFVSSFDNWFGSTIGSLIRTPSDPTLYYDDGLSKYIVGSMDMAAQYNFGLSDVRVVSQTDLNAIPNASSPDTSSLSYVVMSDSDSDADGGAIYLINGGVRYPITSMTQFYNFGFTLNQLGYLPLTDLLRMPVGSNLSNFISGTDGFVYQVNSNVRNGIYDGNLLSQLNPSMNITHVSSLVADNIPLGPATLGSNAVMVASSGQVYLVNSTTGTWYSIPSMDIYNCLGLGNLPNIYFTSSQSTIGTVSNNVSCLEQTSSGQQYIMDGWRRIPVDSSWGLTGFDQIGDSIIDNTSVYNPTTHPIFRTSSSGNLYTLVGGKKDLVASMASFYGNSYTSNDIFTSSTNFLNTITTGPDLLSSGLTFQDSSNGSLYVVSGSNKLYIPSMSIFGDYGFNDTSALDTGTIAAYPSSGTLGAMAYVPTATLFDSGTAWQASTSALQTDYGFSGSTPTYPAAIANNVSSTKQLTQFVKFSSSPTLYYMQNGDKRPIYSMATFASLGGTLSTLTILSDNSATMFPTGPNM